MTAFPEPFDPPTEDPWGQANDAEQAKALERVASASSGEEFAALFSASDPVLRSAAARAAVEQFGGLSDEGLSSVLATLESEATECVWRPLMSSLLNGSPDVSSAGLKRLKAIAVLDPSDVKRAAALEGLIDAPSGTPEWASDFVRERMFSDDSNYVRATIASRVVQGSGDESLRTFAAQWLRHADLVPPALAQDEAFGAVEKDEAYFAHERRPLLSDDLGVRTTRSRAEAAAATESAEASRRGGPTLVQGHHSEASTPIKIQRVLAVVAAIAGVSLVAMENGNPALGLALVVGAIAWAVGLQVWKWYRYG